MEYKIDAKNKALGRVASEIASILQGKKNPGYNPRESGADSVRVANVDAIVLSGRKTKQKVYYKHTGPLGHLKVRKYEEIFKKNPAWVLRHAVNLMLPKNRLRKSRMKRLIIER
ncbi:MAG TPA: 50S ribosomal protein L13 [Candidatus Paceibacterota bacterium]|nr:50S ribosomal protein L13 [Candidatus Paceibacterota bacterium]